MLAMPGLITREFGGRLGCVSPSIIGIPAKVGIQAQCENNPIRVPELVEGPCTNADARPFDELRDTVKLAYCTLGPGLSPG